MVSQHGMHRLPLDRHVIRYGVAAMLLLLGRAVTGVSAVVLPIAVLTGGRWATVAALCGIPVGVAMLIAQWVAASGCHCPLCLGRPLGATRAAPHGNARRMLGSYRLPVALGTVFKHRFRCPFCDAPVAVEKRAPRRSPGKASP